MIIDPNVCDPIKAFGPYDLTPIKDSCSNCEKVNTVKATITINQKPGLICRDCFILYKK
tara:strand:+ start:471 stop:647 length:177 start_codon:yes stop_codon:yes gene_type:complete